MKKINLQKIVFFLAVFFVFSPVFSFAQEIYYDDFIKGPNYVPRQDYDAFNPDGSTKFRSREMVVIYLDFPDGRVPGLSDKKIPETYEELSAIYNYYGYYDAVGELGQINTTTPIHISPSYYAKLFKYTYADRWNMFFSTNGLYKGSSHPDFASHNSTTYSDVSYKAYGSLSEYWKEVSADYFNISPAVTHPNESETMYRTGIVNKIKIVNGVKCIQSIMLPKNKYGNNWSNSYFKSYDVYHTDQVVDTFFSDSKTATINAYINGEIDFDIRQFNGLIVYVFAGGHLSIKGYADIPSKSSFVRGMYGNITSDKGVIDGISCIAHEVGHAEFDWYHVVGGRNTLMNPQQTKDVNCPSHPNPIFKLREGWVTPVHLNYNNFNIQLQPVESSHQVGIVTIYGNPAAAPDHLSGECYVIENRRRLGFDEQLTNDILNQSTFKGGMLIWHYSPYTPFQNIQGSDIKLTIPDETIPMSVIEGSTGNPEFYFAYANNLPYEMFYKLLQNRTYSQEGKKTGIIIDNILQTDHTDLYSNMYFNLNYSISLPPQYDYTILNFNPNDGNKVTHLTGRTFFHKENSFEYFRMYPGSRIDMAPNSSMKFAGIKAIGEQNNKITFASVGYQNSSESHFCEYSGMNNISYSTFNDVDGVFFKNAQFENVIDNRSVIGIKYLSNSNVPVEIENITTDIPNQSSPDIVLDKCLIRTLNINGLKIYLKNISTTQASINILNSNVTLDATCTFDDTSDVLFSNCNINSGTNLLLQPYPNNIWQGIKLEGGGINFSNVTIQGATKGLNLNNLTNDLKISNCTFDNLNQDLTINGYVFNNITDNGRIYHNHFTPTGNNTPIHIWVLNTNYINIDNNYMNSTKWTGIALLNCNMPLVKNNSIEGVNAAQEIGIVSYLSGGTYSCNTVSNCYEGIVLDNSSPVLYQNTVHTNGVGMSLTNNSYPIMSPAVLNNETINLAGYNHFYNNSGNEIYILNTENAVSNLLINNGNNTIEDDVNSEYYLIYIDNQSWSEPELIKCTNNYWGELSDPGAKLFPPEYFDYDPFLTSAPTPPSNCQITVVNEDNSSESQQTLLLGNALSSELNGDFISAADFSQQLTSLGISNTFRKIGSQLFYANKYLSGSGISSLPSFYQNLINSNSNDTLLSKFFRGLKIESKVINSELQSALINLDSVISNPSNIYELMYANIDKLRILSLLDSTSGGDNNGIVNNTISLPDIFNLLKSDLSKVSGVSKLSAVSDKYSKKQSNLNKANTSKYSFLLNRIPGNINNLNALSFNQIKDVMKDKVLYEILTHNYIQGLPPNRSNDYINKQKLNDDNILPKKYSLSQNYPNPFNPSTTIKYALPKDNMVTIKLFDVTGREIKTIVNDYKKAGYYSITFSVSDLSSGIYFYRIHAGTFIQSKIMAFIK